MFGKGKAKQTSNQKFVMSAAKKAGNVFGNHSGGGKSKNVDSPDPYKPRTLKVGKNSRFSD